MWPDYEDFLERNFKNKLPLNYDDRKKSFKDCLKEDLDKYEILLRDSDILNKEQSGKLQVLVYGIKEALNRYYLGKTSEAYKEFSRGVNAIKSELLVLSNKTIESQDLYRIRLSEDADSNMYSCEEMFHIPFEKRHLVNTQRFSIPGLPSVYLGSSLYVCWEELGRPNFKNIKASLYRYQKQVDNKVINLGLSHRELRKAFERQEIKRESNPEIGENNIFSAYCLVWPLIAACSVKVKEKKAAFKTEYIIPQLLSQYVALEKDQFVGIGYLSVSGAHYEETNQDLFCNYFFPVRTSKEKGHCNKLKDTFKLTKGVPWQIFEIHKGTEEVNLYSGINYKHKLPLIFKDINSKIRLDYGDTDFGKFENFLERNLEVKALNPEKRTAGIKQEQL